MGAADYWCEKALSKGLRHLATGQVAHRTTSRLERHNRELRRREQLGTVDGAQPAGIAAKAGAAQPNHLKRNATGVRTTVADRLTVWYADSAIAAGQAAPPQVQPEHLETGA